MADEDDNDPGLPIKLGPCSNGEFFAPPPSPLVREAARRARADCDALARKLGMSRRSFLLSSCGAAATLLALSGCSRDSGGRGGSFTLPPQSATEPDVATTVLGEGLVVDVQTHLLEFDEKNPPRGDFFGSGFPQAGCGDEPWACFSIEHWLQEVFQRSDTTVAVISAIPVVGDPDPLSIEVMERARRAAEQLCGDGRVLIQGHAVPNYGRPEAALDALDAIADAHDIAAWKVYTHAPTPGFRLDDDLGAAFLERVRRTNVPIVSVHKGLSGGNRFASPADIGPAAAAHPDLAFVVYHSGYESGVAEGPYDPTGQGVDRLVASLQSAGIRPGGNVYAELGSTWRQVMTSPDEAAHVLGKLLVAVGPDNVLWGTDSIWYGSPQDQIQAFRTFDISDEFQERFGYPALRPALKAKILAGNAARLYRIDPGRVQCPSSAEREEARQASPWGNQAWGPVSRRDVLAVWRRDHPWMFNPPSPSGRVGRR